ncbi:MAG: hypothetical protein AB8G22_08075 [Saprospiraceae bacterium]
MIKKINLVIVALLLSLTTYAQFGITGGTQFTNNEEWRDIIITNGNEITDEFSNQGWAVGIDYWFRLEKVRIEFLPELRLAHTNSKVQLSDVSGMTDVDLNSLQFNFNTNIYPFDFDGDCDCPVWSKEGPSFSKGFFVRLSPGVNYRQVSEQGMDAGPAYDAAVKLTAAIGVGMDIGISDFITITPLAEHRWFQNDELQAADAPSLTNWFAGIRLGIRFDD